MADTTAMETGCRHVAPSDNGFQARMRFHQSWRRRHVQGLSPGPNPSARNTLYGNILTDADAAAGRNFLTPAIAAYAERRVQEDAASINTTRLRGNLLSSQPMCFNLFAPLALDHELATRLMRTMPDLPPDLTVASVIVEYSPDPARHLQDRTAFDAWIEYALPDGGRGFVGVETKLTEPFSIQRYAFDARYARWQAHADWWWRAGAEERFSDPHINQLWRNHLLAFAMLHQPDKVYSESWSAILYHDEDTACAASIEDYRPLLRSEAVDTLLPWPLSDVVSRWEAVVNDENEKGWLRDLRLRYCDLDASQPAWEVYQASRHDRC